MTALHNAINRNVMLRWPTFEITSENPKPLELLVSSVIVVGAVLTVAEVADEFISSVSLLVGSVD